MIKKMFLSLSILVLNPFHLSAGDFSINAGANHSWLVYPDMPIIKNDFRPSYSVGINFRQPIFQDCNAVLGLRLFNVGRHEEIKTNVSTEQVDMNHTYIGIPLKVEYQLLERFYPFISIESCFQVLSDYKTFNLEVRNVTRTITKEMNTFNLLIGFGLKYLIPIKQHQFGICGQLNYGLLRVPKKGMFNDAVGPYSWEDWRIREVVVYVEYYLGT